MTPLEQELAEALVDARRGMITLALMGARLAGALGFPRDLELERQAIAFVLLGSLPLAALDRLYDWEPCHARLIERLRQTDKPAHEFESGALTVRPLPLLRALLGTTDRLPPAEEAPACILRLEALQRQRRSLAAVIRAARELRSLDGDHAVAEGCLLEAIHALTEQAA